MKSLNAKITGKGQITIPSYIREKLRLISGSRLEFIIQEDSFIVVPINRSAGRLRGILSSPGRSLSVEDMNKVIKSRRSDRN